MNEFPLVELLEPTQPSLSDLDIHYEDDSTWPIYVGWGRVLGFLIVIFGLLFHTAVTDEEAYHRRIQRETQEMKQALAELRRQQAREHQIQREIQAIEAQRGTK